MADKILTKNDITESMINDGNIRDLFKYAKILDVQVGKDKSNLKQNLLLQVLQNKKSIINASWYSDEFNKRKLETIKEDKERKLLLSQYLNDIKSVHSSITQLEKVFDTVAHEVYYKEDPLLEKLNNEKPKINEEFEEIDDCVKRDTTCSLLICGDSGAGKSSFINLLLGEPILPTSIQSNTSCQVKVSYGIEEEARIIDHEGNELVIPKSEFAVKLKNFLENKEDRTKTTCENAIIYLNSSVLEGGLDIYDTIGLGESEKFNDEIKKYIREITGVIFLLKRNSPIGDNAVGGLSQLINFMLKDGLPGGSMNFIINMCDLLQDQEQKDLLKENVMKQLHDKCTNILQPNIITFSTKDELFLQENGKMSVDYEAIMNQIKQLHLSSICTNGYRVYQFLNEYSEKVIVSIKELEKLSSYNDQRKKKHINSMKELKVDRHTLNENFKQENITKLRSKSEKAVKDIIKYLAEKKEEIIRNIIQEQSQLYSLGNIDMINQKIKCMTEEKIVNRIERFNEETGLLRILCDDLIQDFLRHFVEHEKNKEKIQGLVDKHISTVVNIIHGDITKINLQDILQLPPHQRLLLKAISPVIGPVPKTRRFFSENFIGPFAMFLKINRSNMAYFYSNTECHIRKVSSAQFDSIIKKKQKIKSMVEFLFEAPKRASAEFKELLDKDLDRLEKNIRILEDDLRQKDDVKNKYKDIKTKMDKIYNDLCRFSLLHLPLGSNYFLNKEIISIDRNAFNEMPGDSETVPSIEKTEEFLGDFVKPIVYSRSSRLYRAHFAYDQEKKGSLFQLLKGNKSWKCIYREADLYKNIREPYAKYFIKINQDIIYSILENEISPNRLLPTFFTEELISLRSYYTNQCNLIKQTEHDSLPERFKILCEVIKQICLGLSYLHDLTLVHFDMHLNSIAYNPDKKLVKLTSISKPMKVEIDHDKIKTWNQVLEVAHFPKYILESSRNSVTTLYATIPSSRSSQPNTPLSSSFYFSPLPNKYVPECDIYGLATIIYGLWYGIHPFFNEITLCIESVDQLVRKLNTKSLDDIINHCNFKDGFSEQVTTWTSLCLNNKISPQQLAQELGKDIYLGTVCAPNFI